MLAHPEYKWESLLEAYQLRCVAYMNTKKFDKAADDAARLNEMKPDDAWAWGVRGEAVASQTDGCRASLPFLTKSIELKVDALRLTQRAHCLQGIGDTEGAARDRAAAAKLTGK